MKSDPRFIRGLELFNKRDFFECHEVIEELWLETKPDSYSNLYKGVIQAASALHQWKRGYLGGAHRLFLSSTEYLKKYEPTVLGLNVAKLVRDMGACFKVFEVWDRKKQFAIDPSLIPFLEYSK